MICLNYNYEDIVDTEHVVYRVTMLDAITASIDEVVTHTVRHPDAPDKATIKVTEIIHVGKFNTAHRGGHFNSAYLVHASQEQLYNTLRAE